MDSIIKEIGDIKDRNSKLVGYYTKDLISNDKSQKLFTQFQTDLGLWNDSRDKLIKFVQDGDYEQAKAAYPEVSKYREMVLDSLNKEIDLNISSAKQDFNSSQSAERIANITIILVTIIGLLTALLLGLFISSIISRNVKKVLVAAEALGNNDLTRFIDIETNDEIGGLAKSLNKAINNLKSLIKDISRSAKDISTTSQELSVNTQEISSKMIVVNEVVKQISIGAEQLSSTTEEVNGVTEDIAENILKVTMRADEGAETSKTVKTRANGIRNTADKSYDLANKLYSEKQINILKAIADGKIVSEVKTMADVIGSIAGQTNLLALNAAIEAA
jgi:methyl-accepting chemotaxis protein